MTLGSPEREAFRGLALPLYEDLGDLSGQASTLSNLGIEAYYAGDWPKAIDLYQRSRKLRERIGDSVSVAMDNINIGEIHSDQGELDEARTLFEDVVETCDQVGERWLATLARSNLAYLEARAGNLDEAAARLAEAAATFAELNATSYVLETKARQAEVAALQGDGRTALALADEVLADADEAAGMAALQSTAHRIRAAALSQLGKLDAAGAAIDESISVARSGDAIFQLALALDLLGTLDGDRDAASESAELLKQLGVSRVANPPLSS
jgi:tetratricopeptide (TPR) repeat protein